MTVDEVIAKVRKALKDEQFSLFELQLVDDLESLHYIGNLHMDDARWGTRRLILYAFKAGVDTKYIGITYYSYSGDAGGDLEPQVYEYRTREITSIEWVPA